MGSTPRVPHTNTDPLGDMLRRGRFSRMLTQDDVAQAMGVVQSTVSAWESGKVRPKLEDVRGLAELLGLDIVALVDAIPA